ncbi:hypothetical protein K438DRAFT_2062990 [Mycena galopus ATCC 62051]|nr:hypothetical protein K438DRAFT_2062990 [Mycena galopus ATCC 62051]
MVEVINNLKGEQKAAAPAREIESERKSIGNRTVERIRIPRMSGSLVEYRNAQTYVSQYYSVMLIKVRDEARLVLPTKSLSSHGVAEVLKNLTDVRLEVVSSQNRIKHSPVRITGVLSTPASGLGNSLNLIVTICQFAWKAATGRVAGPAPRRFVERLADDREMLNWGNAREFTGRTGVQPKRRPASARTEMMKTMAGEIGLLLNGQIFSPPPWARLRQAISSKKNRIGTVMARSCLNETSTSPRLEEVKMPPWMNEAEPAAVGCPRTGSVFGNRADELPVLGGQRGTTREETIRMVAGIGLQGITYLGQDNSELCSVLDRQAKRNGSASNTEIIMAQ